MLRLKTSASRRDVTANDIRLTAGCYVVTAGAGFDGGRANFPKGLRVPAGAMVNSPPQVWSYSCSKFIYLPENNFWNSGAWVFLRN